MPRRNRRPRRYPLRRIESEPTKSPSYEAMAQDLVRRSLASHLILDRPRNTTQREATA